MELGNKMSMRARLMVETGGLGERVRGCWEDYDTVAILISCEGQRAGSVCGVGLQLRSGRAAARRVAATAR